MLLRRGTSLLRARSERGLYFPIPHRIVDRRLEPGVVAAEADVQSRYRRELRSAFMTGETRQSMTPAWSSRVAPSHFLSLPLPSRCPLRTRVAEVQQSMIFADQQVEPLFVAVAKLHLTLGVMTLPEEEDQRIALLKAIEECVSAACHEVVQRPLQLRFRGLGTFGHGRVLFVRCLSEGDYSTLDALVRRVRRDVGDGLGVDIKGNPHDSYVPHVTVAKIRPSQRATYGDRLPMAMWASFQHHDFGDVTFDRIDVCQMRGAGDNGYYPVNSSVKMA